MRRTGDLEAGFTLVETLAAFAILMLVLSALFIAATGAIKANARAGFVRTAMRLGQSQLALAGVTGPLVPGEMAGRFENGYVWRQKVSGYRGEIGGAAGGGGSGASIGAAPLYWVELSIRPSANADARAASFELVTVKPARGAL